MTDSEKRVTVKREDLEKLLFKGGPSTVSFAFLKPLLFIGALIASFFLVVTFLPQRWFDRLTQTLQASGHAISRGLEAEKLDLTDLKEEWNGEFLLISGTVRNATNGWIKGVVAVIKLHGKNDIVNTLYVDLYEPVLGPGKSGGFRLAYRYPEGGEPLAYYELNFQLKDGSPMAHRDLRASGPTK